jgi:hypothetical protein
MTLYTTEYFDYETTPNTSRVWKGVNVFLPWKRTFSVIVVVKGGNKAGMDAACATALSAEVSQQENGYYKIVQVWASPNGACALHVAPYHSENSGKVSGAVLVYEIVK